MINWDEAANELLRRAAWHNALKSEFHVRASEPQTSQEDCDEVTAMLQQVQWEWWMRDKHENGL